MRAVIIMILSGILFAAHACSVASGQAFRMETDVKIVGDKEATCQTLTLFSSGLVYDFLTTGKGEKEVKEVTVFDMNNQRIVLLDTKRCVKTVLTHEQLLQLTASLKAHTSEENPIFYFAANPKFEVKFDELGSQLTLASPLMTYVIKGVKPQATTAMVNYQEFADWSARLNACRGNLPPFARMEVSRAMAERELIPETITRTIVSPGKFGSRTRKSEVQSTHMVNWILSTTDRRRIETVGEQIAKFDAVTWQEFVEPERLASKK